MSVVKVYTCAEAMLQLLICSLPPTSYLPILLSLVRSERRKRSDMQYNAINQKLLMSGFEENVQKTLFLTLNPQIKIFFQNSGRVTFFTLLTPNFMQSFRKIE